MRLLLVEDHMVVRETMAEFLAAGGFVVDTCGSIAEARDALSTLRYDVMLVDLSLPDGCGLAFLRDVISKTRGALPVLVVSARNALEDRVTYRLPFGWLGNLAHPWLVKPQLDRIFAFRQQAVRELFPD